MLTYRLPTAGFAFAEVAEQLGVSLTTAWRRCRWFEDWSRLSPAC
jgi:hypothetical protein